MRLQWNQTVPTRTLISLSAAGLGASCVMTQLVFMREMLGAFWGNEMTLGLVLGHWLLLSGIGAWLGGKTDRWNRPTRFLCCGICLMALLPVGQVYLLRILRDVVFIRGAMTGLLETVVAMLIFLSPYCLVTGFLLPLLGVVLTREGSGPTRAGDIGRIYMADSLGSIVGGVLFSFVLVRWLDHFSLLFFPAAFNLLLAGLIAWRCAHWTLAVSAVVLLGLTLFVLPMCHLDQFSTARQYPGQKVLWRKNSPYGRLVLTERRNQIDIYENGLPILSSQQIERLEETVHYAMAQHPEARRVLLVGGGVAGTVQEIAKYRVEEITYVELDPAIIEAGRRFLPHALAVQALRIVTTDGRRFIQQTTNRFEVVILDLPDPSTLQINRFYTAEFFTEVKGVLAPGGIVALGLGHYENFVGKPLARLLSSLHRTLRQSFAEILMIPGGRVYFLASDQPLDDHLADRLEAKKIATRLVKRNYLESMLAADRRADLARAIAEPAQLNRDLSPALYYYHWVHWLSQWSGRSMLVLLPLGGLAIYMARLRGAGWAMFATGFAASTMEIVLLLGMQAFGGSLYYQLGAMVTLFMAGLAAGVPMASRLTHPNRRAVMAIAGLTGVYACAVPFVLIGLSHGHQSHFFLAPLVLPLLAFVLGMLAGGQFLAASQWAFTQTGATAARMYLADYVGASAGALLACLCLLPWAGVLPTCLVAGGLCFISAWVCGRG